ncbi:exodeoxyribonuclease VII small subunit [Acidimicrobiia bacterium EGI L10123]|uniref:exodeoxyribonuclease VII small subunit n=1 Tax=Salinilacustrithrix flava TaxID=2957203 RepID=UPI003D7C26EB|nr:exodeoxyribonuclease VII small subunit [Acidimicrobiia bacterium EGI L10123]
MSSTDAPDDREPAGYGEAVTELESILREIEDVDVDVDVLAERVRRAAQLIDWCRGRILAARTAVEDATADLVDDDPS